VRPDYSMSLRASRRTKNAGSFIAEEIYTFKHKLKILQLVLLYYRQSGDAKISRFRFHFAMINAQFLPSVVAQ